MYTKSDLILNVIVSAFFFAGGDVLLQPGIIRNHVSVASRKRCREAVDAHDLKRMRSEGVYSSVTIQH